MMSEMCTLNSKKNFFAYDGGGKLAYKEDKIQQTQKIVIKQFKDKFFM